MNKIFFHIIFYFPILALGQVEPDSNRINLFETVCIDSNAVNQFPFINFDENIFTFPSNENESWDELYNSMDSMIRFKDRKLNFYHIGGSHIQADIYTHDFRSFYKEIGQGSEDIEASFFHLI